MKYLEIAELDRLAEALTVKTNECRLQARLECYTLKSVTAEKKLFKELEDKYLAVVRQVMRELSVGSDGGHDQVALEEHLGSPFGPLGDPNARKTLFTLIATLNASFPDHDFTNVSPEDFQKEIDPQHVVESINTTLSNLGLSSHAVIVRSPALRAQISPSLNPASASESIRIKRDQRGSSKQIKFKQRLSASTSSTSPNMLYGSPSGLRDLPASKYERRDMLWEVVDSVIGLHDCEVYSYNPDTEADPHASYSLDDFSTEDGDDERFRNDDVDSFQLDQYQTRVPSHRKRQQTFGSGAAFDSPVRSRILSGYPSRAASRETSMAPTDTSTETGDLSAEDLFSLDEVDETSVGDEEEEDAADGGLIWSDTYFFLNRKVKRLLFFTVWSVSPRMRDRPLRRLKTVKITRDAQGFLKPQQSFLGSRIPKSTLQDQASDSGDMQL